MISFSDWVLGNSKKFSAESRLLHLGIAIVVLSILVPVIINLSIGFSLKDNAIFLGNGLLLSVVTYFSRVRNWYTAAILLFLWICWSTLITSWIVKGGLVGVTPLYFIMSALLVVIIRKNWLVPTLLVIVLTFSSLILLELNGHLTINAYPSDAVRYLDLILTYMLIFGLLVYANLMIVREGEFRNLLLQQKADDAMASKEEWKRLHEEVASQKEELSQKNRELAALNDKQTKLFSVISHDLKTPLSNIKTSLQFLQEAESDPVLLSDLLPKLDRDIGLTSNMLENLLQWSRMQLSGIHPQPQRINVCHTLSETMEIISSYASFKDIQVETHIPENIEMDVDAESLKLVVRNLAINAVKYSHAKNLVSVRCQTVDDVVQFEIEDWGIGIAKDKLDQLFLAENLPTAGTNNEKGTGLGLALCKMHVESHKGKITIDSIPGKGSRFTVTLPCS